MAVHLAGMTKQETEQRLDAAIATGEELRDRAIDNDEQLDDARRAAKQWDDHTEIVLQKAFGPDAGPVSSFANVLRPPPRTRISSPDRRPPPPTLVDKIKKFRSAIRLRVNELQSIRGTVELYDEPRNVDGNTRRSPAEPTEPSPTARIRSDSMDPAARLKVITELAKHSGGDLWSFFAAFGYGDAYKAPGKGASKATSIAAVVTRAEHDGRDIEVLEAARQHFDIDVGAPPTPREPESPETAVTFAAPLPNKEPIAMIATSSTPKSIFIVHGRDPHGYRERVARIIEKATTLEAIILDEQPNLGKTLIDKFMSHATAECAAVVIMTGDDLGRLASDDPNAIRPRPRQNVVLELGYFIGKLPPERTIVLRENDLEGPSDFAGVTYVSLDAADWKHRLGKELSATGVTVDFTKIV